VVRLLRGDFSAETVYGGDALAVARRFEADGTSWIHMVDLDAARTGEPANLDTIAAVVGAVACKVQVGGGVRDVDAAARLIDVGVARVVVGTAAVEHPALVDGLCARFPDRVAVGLDAKGREVAVRGWVEGSGVDVVDLATRFEQSGVAALVVTGILTDGTLEGPDLEVYEELLASVALPVVASGGVGALDDLRSLDALDVSGRRLAGAIVGRALYERRFTVAEAVDALRP
jgi:phosphoribosylformimino-5-aminoimidazole carboxamide ribotide isomerase